MSHKVLLFDRDAISLAAMRDVLDGEQCHVACAQTVHDVLRLSFDDEWDIAVIDMVSDQSVGLDVLRTLRERPHAPACVVTLRFGHEFWKAEAMSLGAFQCIEQPITATLLTALVHAAAEFRRGAPAQTHADSVAWHALSRWADVVVRGVESGDDPRTLAEWGRAVAVSTGALRNWCRTAGIPARGSLLFARTLRAVIRHSSTAAPPEDLLNIVDRRTLTKVLRAAGGTGSTLPNGIQDFLQRQTFIKNASALLIVSAVLESRSAHDRLDSVTTVRHAAGLPVSPEAPAPASAASMRHVTAHSDVPIRIAS